MTKRNHVVISGTGRAGTTVLVQLLTKLGLDTGFDADRLSEEDYHATARAGLETDIRRETNHYVVKSPQFCDYAGEVFEDPTIIVDHVFIPMRDLDAAAESRRRVHKETIGQLSLWKRIRRLLPGHKKKTAGGLRTRLVQSREDVKVGLQDSLYKLILACSAQELPVTLLHYPTHTQDSRYTYNKLKPILKEIDYPTFEKAFQEVVNPNLVSSYTASDNVVSR